VKAGALVVRPHGYSDFKREKDEKIEEAMATEPRPLINNDLLHQVEEAAREQSR
jgi:hypothetical protein